MSMALNARLFKDYFEGKWTGAMNRMVRDGKVEHIDPDGPIPEYADFSFDITSGLDWIIKGSDSPGADDLEQKAEEELIKNAEYAGHVSKEEAREIKETLTTKARKGRLKKAIASVILAPIAYLALDYLIHNNSTYAAGNKPKVATAGEQSVNKYIAMGKEMEKIADFQTRIDRYKKHVSDPNNNSALFFNQIGVAYWHTGKKQKAIDCLKRATELNPNHPTYWHNLGVYYKRVGDIPNAIKAIGKYANMLPNDDPSRKKIEVWIEKNR